MYSKDVNSKISILMIIFIIMSFVFSLIIIMFDKIPDFNYKLLSILPISFAGISAIFYKVYSYFFKKISIPIIISLYFIRMSVIPLGIVLTNEKNYSEAISFLNNTYQTIFILIYEFFCIMLVLFLILQKESRGKTIVNNEVEDKIKLENNSVYFKIILSILCIFVIIMFIKYPLLKGMIRTLFENQGVEYISTNTIKNSVPSALYWIFAGAIDILYIVIPFLIIYRIFRTKFSINIKIFISLFVIGTFTYIATSDKFKSIIMAFSLLVILMYLYPAKRKFILATLFILGVTGFAALAFKNSIDSEEYDFIRTLQLYFSGPFSVSVGFEMPDDADRFQVLINDITSSLSYIKVFFTDSITTTKLYNVAFYQKEYLYDKIIPMISQSAYYFGNLSAPLLSCLVTLTAVKIEKNFSKKKNLFSKYVLIYTVIYLSASVVTYNISIVISGLTGIILPLYIMALINQKRGKAYNATYK